MGRSPPSEKVPLAAALGMLAVVMGYGMRWAELGCDMQSRRGDFSGA